MKAATRTRYGSPDILKVRNIKKPRPDENQLLIRVYATTVNRTDIGVLTGMPWVFRFFTGLTEPRYQVTGTDFAGRVEAVGDNVTDFKKGDKVWGFLDHGLPSHAEYMVIAQNQAILKIPEGISFAEAVACAEGAHYAYNFINKIDPKPGQNILVYGATGAIGSAAVQLLKNAKLNVTAVCATPHVDLVKGLGPDRVIDYLIEDFTKGDQEYDFVLDAVGKSSFGKCKPILKPKGVYASSELGPRMENIYLSLLTPLSGGKKVVFPLPTNIKGSMNHIQKLVEAGKFKPLIDRTYPLDDIAEAFRYVASGQKIGNVIISME